MHRKKLLAVIPILLAFCLLTGCGQAPGGTTPYVIKDLIPPVNYEKAATIRQLVKVDEKGELYSETQWPTHRQGFLLGGMLIYLEPGGTQPFSLPLKEAPKTGVSPNFTGSIAELDWFAGVEHILIGKINIDNYVFESDAAYPLTFKVVKDTGYRYLCGKGTVTTPKGQKTELGQKDTVADWLKKAASTDQLDREGAAQALGYLGAVAGEADKQLASAKLIELLHDPAYEVRRDALEAQALLIKDPKALPVIQELANSDGNEWVKAAAIWALTRIGN
jgi:hypothetical protein